MLDPIKNTAIWEIAGEVRASKADLEFMETAFKWQKWYWPFIAPPGLPPERAKILREAFHRALNDRQLLEEGARMGLVPDPIDPEKLQVRGPLEDGAPLSASSIERLRAKLAAGV